MTFSEATSGKPGQRILPLVYCGGDVRYFIAIGFPGFNSPANNRSGYASPEGALAASLRYERKGHREQSVGSMAGTFTGPTFREPTMNFEFNSDDYELLHGKTPRGYGHWAFNRDGQPDDKMQWFSGTFAAAKKLAKAHYRLEVERLLADKKVEDAGDIMIDIVVMP